MDQRSQYYKALSKLFETSGWKLFVEDVMTQIEGCKSGALSVDDMRQLGVLQGRAQAFNEILILEDTINLHMADLKEDDDADL